MDLTTPKARGAENGEEKNKTTPGMAPPPVQKSDAVGLEPALASSLLQPPALSLPPSGGAIRSLGEKFSVNQVNGTASLSIPIATTECRGRPGPALSLSYDSGAGNGVWGLGWRMEAPSITRALDKQLPRYIDAGDEADVFVLAGSEDLVPEKTPQGNSWVDVVALRQVDGVNYSIQRYRPRIESAYLRIERWTAVGANGSTHWRTISGENVTTIFGQDSNSRIADPTDPAVIFSWLASATYDAKGNATTFQYKAEDSAGIFYSALASERNRTAQGRTANRYIKSIKYGNSVSRLVNPDLSAPSTTWHFEVVFDYGEHNLQSPTTAEDGPWLLRSDPFSTYRPGFEVRTYRLCRRILMFHHFPNEPNVGRDCLVSSTDFTYQNNSPDGHSFIVSTSISGYLRSGSGYTSKSTPPVEFTYSAPVISSEVKEVVTDDNPIGLSESYQFVDLDGEGMSGILASFENAWYYKSNLGGGNFADIYPLPKPSSKSQTLMDLDHDGRLEFVDLEPPFSGYVPRMYVVDDEGDVKDAWGTIVPFKSLPNISWKDPNLAFVDVNGDGNADVLITEEDVITYYPSLGTLGFGSARQVHTPLDEDLGPRCVLSDPLKTIHVADMSGDGLLDIVRVRNGAVSYWPNLGYGHFGCRVVMDGLTSFDREDSFRTERVVLADVDGSGTTDIVYVGLDGSVKIYFNLSGNGFSQPQSLSVFPQMSNKTSIKVADLLGRGTSCLIWSSSLPADAHRPLKYVELMKRKPNLLTSIINNRGMETKIHYTSSTKFYLQDKVVGKPWITRLPFPVQVVEYVEYFEHIAKTRTACRYAYHDGFYDGLEREFRGFAMVEAWDTAEFSSLGGTWQHAANDNASSNTPPALTKTWYHNGAYVDQTSLQTVFRKDYFQEPGSSGTGRTSNMNLPDNMILDEVIASGNSISRRLTTGELREAYRAMKGSMLRTEMYALDGSALQQYPYVVSEKTFRVRLLQPRGRGIYQYGVFQTFEQESLTWHYERQIYSSPMGQIYMAPRGIHEITLKTDQYGNVLQKASITYGRLQIDSDVRLTSADHAKQAQMYATYSNVLVTNAIVDEDDDYALPVPYESIGYEILKFQDSNTNLVQITDLQAAVAQLDNQADLPLDDWSGIQATGTGPYRRVLSHSVTIFRSNDLSQPLGLGTIQSLMIPYQTYTLSSTGSSLQQAFVNSDKLTAPDLETALSNEAYLVHGYDGNDVNWWKKSGTIFFAEDSNATVQQELLEATANFFTTRRYRSPFHTTQTLNETFVGYDPYVLMVQEIRDALGNRKTVGARDVDPTKPLLHTGFDYVMMKPVLVMDANRNRSAVLFDEIGNVIETAIMGKPEENLGDSIDEFAPLSDADILGFLQNPQAQNRPPILRNATSVTLVDVFAYYRTKTSANPQPTTQCTLSRETHVSESKTTKIQCKFAYLDGAGHTIQQKVEAEPDQSGPRWNCTGWTVLNNKGDPVQTFEPFYTNTHAFQSDYHAGVASTTFYDPIRRAIGVLYPDHTWTKTRFDPWKTEKWNAHQTVLLDPKTDLDLGGYFIRLSDAEYLPTWYQQRANGGQGPSNQTAAQQSALFSGLQAVMFADSLGRSFLTITENIWQRTGEANPTTSTVASRQDVDIQGRAHVVTDVLGRTVMQFDYTVSGEVIHSSSMDAGEVWILSDIKGSGVYRWNSRGYRFHNSYDALRRPISVMLMLKNTPGVLISKTIYGESAANPESINVRERVYDSYDQCGRKLVVQYDFKGNQLKGQRQLPTKYDDVVDLSTATYESDTYILDTTYDALNRPTSVTNYQDAATPLKSTSIPGYDTSGLFQTLTANLPFGNPTQVVSNVQYTAFGQRSQINYGNGSTTSYAYDPLTQRLINLTTKRSDGSTVQNLSYIYDASGNPTNIMDSAQQTVYFDNAVVDPSSSYIYDALHKLIQVTGREHLGQIGATAPGPWDPDAGTNGQDPRNGAALARYTESYFYDLADNILSVEHVGSAASTPGWTRTYNYAETSPLQPSVTNNRLSSTSVGSSISQYKYDGPAGVNGCMTSMPHLSVLNCGFNDMIQATATQNIINGTPETTYYQYDPSNSRCRKVTNRQAQANATPVRKSERIYLGAFEIYREFAANGVDISLERQSINLSDGTRRVALVEMRMQGTENTSQLLMRYQFTNVIGSTCLELNEDGQVMSYEEYYPFGSSSYRATGNQLEAPKRYRYNGKERDEENGFYYMGARYYASWLGRWTAADPAGLVDGANLYHYSRNNPVRLKDPGGTESQDPTPQKPGSKPGPQPDPTPDPKPEPRPSYYPRLYPPPWSFDLDDPDDKAAQAYHALHDERPANLWFASWAQGLGTPADGQPPNWRNDEIGLTLSKQTTAQLALLYALHLGIPAVPGLDWGLMGGGTLTEPGTTLSGQADVLFHYGKNFSEDSPWGAAGYLTIGTTNNFSNFAINGVIDIGLEPKLDPRKNILRARSATLAINPTGSYATNNTLASGPLLKNVGSGGLTVGGGAGFGPRINVQAEIAGSVTHGDAITPGGPSGTGVLVHAQVGGTLSTWGHIDGNGTYSIGVAPFLNFEHDWFSGSTVPTRDVWTGGVNVSFGYNSKYGF